MALDIKLYAEMMLDYDCLLSIDVSIEVPKANAILKGPWCHGYWIYKSEVFYYEAEKNPTHLLTMY